MDQRSVVDRPAGDLRAHLDHPAGGLVPQRQGEWEQFHRQMPNVDVGVAQSGATHLQQDFVGIDVGNRNVDDG